MRQNRELAGFASACLLVQLLAASSGSSLALAAELEQVQSFDDNPSSTRMFIYVPDKLAAVPPILVAIHYCTGSAQAFFTGTSYRGQADRHGFIVIYPESTDSDRCFDVHSEATLKHEGGGESAAIAAMVRYVLREYQANAQRVYVTGTSSGAMMTNVMVGAYPELFRAGAAFAGVPFGCFAGPDRWDSDCAEGRITKTGQEWGELVRAAYPGYTGPRPRMQLWHGDRDETLSFHNFGEEIKQWSNVLGVSEMPTSTEQGAPEAGWTRTRYADSAGVVRVEAMVGPGMPHNLAVLGDEALHFFGLDADRDPADVSGAAAGSGGASANAAGAGAAGRAGSAAPANAPSSAAAGSGGSGQLGAAGVPGMTGAAGAGGANVSSSSQAAASAGANASPRAAAAGRTASVAANSSGAGRTAAGAPATMSNVSALAAADAAPAQDSESCSVSWGSPRRPSHAWLMLSAMGLFRVCRRVRKRRSVACL